MTGPVRRAGPTLRERILPNGLRVSVEARPDATSVAIEGSLRFGAADDPDDLLGASTLAWAWQERAAAGRSARERADAFAQAGVRVGSGCGRERSVVAARGPAAAWREALALLTDPLLHPDLQESTFEPARLLCSNALAGRDERPDAVADDALREAAFLAPFGRSAYGMAEGLAVATADRIRDHLAAALVPDGAVLVVVGPVDPDEVLDTAEALFGTWRARSGAPRPVRRFAPGARHVVPLASEQVQLAWAWQGLAPTDPRFSAVEIAVTVLGGGPGSRLFDEVRERRGLVYGVGAEVWEADDAAWTEVGAQATTDRAGEVEATIEAELGRMAQGVSEDEIDRARLRLATDEALHAETPAGRAAQIVQDVRTGRAVRTLDERLGRWADVDASAVLDAWCTAPPDGATRVIVGPGAEDAGG